MVPDPAVTTPDVYIAANADQSGDAASRRSMPNGNPYVRLRPSDHAQDRQFREPALVGMVPRARFAKPGWQPWFRRQLITGTTSRIATARSSRSATRSTSTPSRGTWSGQPSKVSKAAVPTAWDSRKDPGASWNSATKSIQGSCAPGICADGLYHATSPRIVPVALFDHRCLLRGFAQRQDERDHHEHHGLFHRGHGRSRQQGRHRPPRRNSRPDQWERARSMKRPRSCGK